ncbi:MAG TPA: patatin-like phospholipase family protein, partial [Paracoccaceae bacterium]|nr:patatin-like phospholipase family protein [Paracoccaceae bacterium]
EERLRIVRAQIAARIEAEGTVPDGGYFDVLALSGGGPDGAYGAGLLDGWSDGEDRPGGIKRPEFSLVTGISVGALIAPFAFLGPDYDDALERLFTTTSTADLVNLALFDALLGYTLGLADVRPLEDMLDQIVTPTLVQRIAEEHRKGRRLWIGTTNLDAERPVIWDIGAIAGSAYPRKALLIRKILLASSAIPGAFPPVEFPVEIGGEIYSEMHVDGSVTRQLFVFPSNIALGRQIDEQIPGLDPGTIYLVRNSKLLPDYDPVEPSLLSILERSLFTLTNALALGDVESIEQQAEAEGWRLLSSSVPPEFEFPAEDFFDPRYMRALYEVGYERAVAGVAWTVLHDPDAPENVLAEAG